MLINQLACFMFVVSNDFDTESSTTTSDNFPTPESLREANSGYKQKATEKDDNGRVVPSPAVRTKQQVFRLEDYKAIDARACQVYLSEAHMGGVSVLGLWAKGPLPLPSLLFPLFFPLPPLLGSHPRRI